VRLLFIFIFSFSFTSLFFLYTKAQTLTSPGGEYTVTQTKITPIATLTTGSNFSVTPSGDPIVGSFSGSGFSVESSPSPRAAVTQSSGSSGGGGGGGGTVIVGRESESGGQILAIFGQVGEYIVSKAQNLFTQLGSSLGVIGDRGQTPTDTKEEEIDGRYLNVKDKEEKYIENNSYGSIPYNFEEEAESSEEVSPRATPFSQSNPVGWWILVLISALGLMGIASRFWFSKALPPLSSAAPNFSLKKDSLFSSENRVLPVSSSPSLPSLLSDQVRILLATKKPAFLELALPKEFLATDQLANLIKGFQGSKLMSSLRDSFDSSLRVFLQSDGELASVGYVLKQVKDDFNPEVLEEFEKDFFKDLFFTTPLGSSEEFHPELFKGKYMIRSAHFPDGKNAFDYGIVNGNLVLATSHEIFVRILEKLI